MNTIEFCLTQLNEIPSKFIGFYTMALINLKIVLKIVKLRF